MEVKLLPLFGVDVPEADEPELSGEETKASG